MNPLDAARTIARQVGDGSIDVAQPTTSALRRLRHANPTLRAVRSIDDQGITSTIENIRSWLSDGDCSLPLAGVPLLVKDNVAQRGWPNRAGRCDGAGVPCPNHATIVDRLLRAGAVVVGRANMDELAYGVTGSNPHTGQVIHPIDPEHHPGGSSAGSAVAVAADLVPLAIGTDTAGSVRIPAALCGVVGLRPTHGRFPTDGVASLAPSLDCLGPIGRNVADVALLSAVLADEPELANVAAQGQLRQMRIAAVRGSFAWDVESSVDELFGHALTKLEKKDADVVEVTLPLKSAPRTVGPILGAEAALVWAAELEQHPDWFGEEVTDYLVRGAKLTAVRYLRASEERRILVDAIEGALRNVDLLALPTTPTPTTCHANPGPQLQFLALTTAFSLTGHPAITVPMGDVDGLPVGLQLVGRRGAEGTVLRTAFAFECAHRDVV